MDPVEKKRPPNSHNIKRLVTHIEQGGVLVGHKDVPDAVRDQLHRHWQKDKRTGGYALGTGVHIFLSIFRLRLNRIHLDAGGGSRYIISSGEVIPTMIKVVAILSRGEEHLSWVWHLRLGLGYVQHAEFHKSQSMLGVDQ